MSYLAQRKLLKETVSLVSFPEDKILINGDLGAAVLGRHQHLEGAEVLRVGVQGLPRTGGKGEGC